MTDPTPRPEDVVDALVEKVLGDPRSLRREEVAEQSGVPLAEARRLWRAMGFADVGDAVAFTRGDLEALRALDSLVLRDLLDRDDAVEVTRALGLTTSRLADWQADTFGRLLVESGALDRDDPLGPESAAGLGRELDLLLPVLEKLLVHVWRRQLAAALERGLADAEADGEVETGHLTVGFADQVGFTRLSRRLEEDELAQLVERFESRSADIVVSAGGRLIKTLGDEVLFVAPTLAAGAEIALDLVDRDPDAPPVRCGLAFGPTVGLGGDVFGPTVNLAARLTAVARPGRVLLPLDASELLVGHDGVAVKRVGRKYDLKGIGSTRVATVTRSEPG